MQYVVTTYVPQNRNDGSEVSKSELDGLLLELVEITAGCSVTGPVRGLWAGESQVYDELNNRVDVTCSKKAIKAVREWVVSVGERLGQEAMYWEVRKSEVEIIRIK